MRTTSPARPESNSPSVEFRQHHAVEPPHIGRTEFRPAWRVRTQLDTLLVRGFIGRDEYLAGDRFRSLWHRAFSSLTPSSLRRMTEALIDGMRTLREPIVHVAAIGRVVELEARLGKTAFNLLVCLLILDLPWVELAKRCRLHRTTAKQHAIAALEELARRLNGR
jgi:hypothetical protein